MIKLKRGNAPSSLVGLQAAKARAEILDFLKTPRDQRRQLRFKNWNVSILHAPDVLASLESMTFGKCSYCESSPDESGGPIVRETYRPRSRAMDSSGQYAADHYIWLAYEWTNFLVACAPCNMSKANKFPIKGTLCSVGTMGIELDDEKPLLLDPTRDDPAEHLAALGNGVFMPLSDRGQASISLLNLNRPSLVEMRLLAYEKTLELRKSLTENAFADLANKISMGMLSFSAFRRAAFEGGPQRGPIVSFPKSEETTGVHYIQSIEIRNFRGIETLDLKVAEANEHGAPWTMFIGENGVGKSTVLQALALAVSEAPSIPSGITPLNALRHSTTDGSVRVHLAGISAPREVTFSAAEPNFSYSGPLLSHPLAGYGATRLLSPDRAEVDSACHVENLFDPSYGLLTPTDWLARRDDEDFDYAARVLRGILLLTDKERFFKDDNGNVNLRMAGADLSFSELSDGYRSMAALIVDIIAFLQHQYPSRPLETVEATVLIDEIGANLHPRWKMRVVKSLRRELPFVQVFATTHDPLCLRGCANGEVSVLRRLDGKAMLAADLPNVEGLRVDQLLMSEYFGLKSTLDPDLEDEFAHYYQLLAKRVRTDEEESETKTLAKKLEPMSLPGLSRRERLLLRFVDEFLARSNANDDANVNVISEDVRQQIREALRSDAGL